MKEEPTWFEGIEAAVPRKSVKGIGGTQAIANWLVGVSGMNTKFIFLTALVLALQGCATARKSLGHGYSIINRSEEMAGVPGVLEGKSYHREFYYRSQKLGTVGQYSVAPSGRYAVFESDGKLLLFAAESKRLQDETNGRFYVPKTVEWREGAGTVVVTFYDVSETRTIQLSGRNRQNKLRQSRTNCVSRLTAGPGLPHNPGRCEMLQSKMPAPSQDDAGLKTKSPDQPSQP